MTDANRTAEDLHRPLTPRQERFVREFLKTGNAKRSAILAGFSPRSAKQVGSALLRKDAVKQAIQGRPSDADLPIPEFSTEWALRRLVEEIGDPNPRVRLDAKKAVAQAVGLFALAKDKDKEEKGCRTCVRFSGLEALDTDDLKLAIAGTNRTRLTLMSASDFERWAAAHRAEVEMWISAARAIRESLLEPAPQSPGAAL